MDKPSVTDAHIEKFNEIMKTPTPQKPEVKPAPSTPLPQNTETKTEQKTNNLAVKPDGNDITSKGFIFTGHKMMSLDKKEKKDVEIPGQKKHSPLALTLVAVITLLIGWTAFWAYFFGYFKF